MSVGSAFSPRAKEETSRPTEPSDSRPGNTARCLSQRELLLHPSLWSRRPLILRQTLAVSTLTFLLPSQFPHLARTLETSFDAECSSPFIELSVRNSETSGFPLDLFLNHVDGSDVS